MSHGRTTPATDLARADAAVAAVMALTALAIYVRTLAPGVVPILDTPGFQFVGRILGTLHHPGYPTYTLVTWLWSFLPVGSLAYRINLFSAVAASLAVAGAFVLMRLLGVRRWIAAAAVLGLAFGSIYWSQAVIAEVYAPNAALISWMLAATVAWKATGGAWFLYAACGLFAAGLGNHTTIALFAPALAIYALSVDHRYVLRLRTVAALLLIILLGLAQYLFILVRTRMGAVYLESYAGTLRELVHVMRGAQFERALFAFPLREVLSERVPLIVGRFVRDEMTAPVLACALLGVMALLARRPREGVLVLAGLAGQLLFVLNYDAGDIHVFTIPTLLLLWICAAVGIEEIAGRFGRSSRAGRLRLAAVPLAAAVAAFPFWQGARNFADRDLSDDTVAMRQLDALFAALPDDTFLVRENFVLDRMLMYKILGENAGAGREIQAHQATAEGAASMHVSGRHVFAFTETAHRYRSEGVNVRFSPFPVDEQNLAEFLSRLPEGTVVAIAVPGAHAPSFHRAAGDALRLLAAAPVIAGREQAALAVAGVLGSPARGRTQLDTRSSVSATLEGATARADALTATVAAAGRERLSADDGAVMAVLTPDGRLQGIRTVPAETGFRVRAPSGPFIPARVLGLMPERTLAPGWSDVSGGTGLWLVTLPPGARVEMAAAVGAGCALRAVEKSSDALRASAPGDLDLPPSLQGGTSSSLVLETTESAGVFVAAGCRARLVARSHNGSPRLQDAGLAGMLDLPERSVETLLMARTPQSWLLGAGWSPVDTSEAGPFRWIDGRTASLLLPVERQGSTRLRVQAFTHADAETELRLALDGTDLPVRRLQAGWHWYDWSFERSLDATVHQLTFTISGVAANAAGGVAISQVEVLPARGW